MWAEGEITRIILSRVIDMADVKANVNEKAIKDKIENLVDDSVMIEIHTLFAKMIDPWVPKNEGILSQTLQITSEFVRYYAPYAHYQYVGEVYSPNIPVYEGGNIVGWFSPPGKKKHPTGRPLGKPGQLTDSQGNVIWTFGYNREQHPLATSHWDKVAMQSQLEIFERQVKDILARRAKQLYG